MFFFMMGVNQGRKNFDYNDLIICKECGSYGRLNVFMTYMCLSIFFIPVFKWNKRYYVQTSCCNTIYELDPEIGKQIQWGQKVDIKTEHLSRIQQEIRKVKKKCHNCGYETEEDFEFCPKCGNSFQIKKIIM